LLPGGNDDVEEASPAASRSFVICSNSCLRACFAARVCSCCTRRSTFVNFAAPPPPPPSAVLALSTPPFFLSAFIRFFSARAVAISSGDFTSRCDIAGSVVRVCLRCACVDFV
jgi:hypothetical protein